NHYQTLSFIRAGSPEFYALISGQPFAITLAIVAFAFIVVGCIGIWKQRRTPASLLGSHDAPHHVTSHGPNSPAIGGVTGPVSVVYNKIPQFVTEIPAGELNGSNTVFGLSHAPIEGSLELIVNIPQLLNVD